MRMLLPKHSIVEECIEGSINLKMYTVAKHVKTLSKSCVKFIGSIKKWVKSVAKIRTIV